MGISTGVVISPARLQQGGQILAAFGIQHSVFVEHGPEEGWMCDIGEYTVQVGHLIELVGFSGIFIQEYDRLGLAAHQTEIVEVVQVHDFEAHLVY